jgi:hypothetical protein
VVGRKASAGHRSAEVAEVEFDRDILIGVLILEHGNLDLLVLVDIDVAGILVDVGVGIRVLVDVRAGVAIGIGIRVGIGVIVSRRVGSRRTGRRAAGASTPGAIAAIATVTAGTTGSRASGAASAVATVAANASITAVAVGVAAIAIAAVATITAITTVAVTAVAVAAVSGTGGLSDRIAVSISVSIGIGIVIRIDIGVGIVVSVGIGVGGLIVVLIDVGGLRGIDINIRILILIQVLVEIEVEGKDVVATCVGGIVFLFHDALSHRWLGRSGEHLASERTDGVGASLPSPAHPVGNIDHPCSGQWEIVANSHPAQRVYRRPTITRSGDEHARSDRHPDGHGDEIVGSRTGNRVFIPSCRGPGE